MQYFAGMNGWVNTGEAGDLRRHRTYYDVILMAMPSDDYASLQCA